MNNSKVGLKDLIESSVELGVLTNMDYTHAVVASNDYKVNAAGGVPRNCFLLAVSNDENLQEAILLSVRDIADLESLKAFKALKEDLAQRIGDKPLDASTRQRVQSIGYNCKIVGTFYEDERGLQFGADVDRVLAYSSYRVLRPMGKSLSQIASFSRSSTSDDADNNSLTVDVGVVRYTETQKIPDTDAKVMVNVKDFIGKKTAVFGMSRSGKALTADTRVPVPTSKKFKDGWARNDELKVGDMVYSINRTPIQILELKPWENKETSIVKLENCATITAANDHLWTITKTQFELKQDINDIAAAIIEYAKYVGVGTYSSLAEISNKTRIPTEVLFNIATYTNINKYLTISDSKYTGDAGDSIYYPVSELLYNVARYINNDNSKEALDIIVTTEDLKNNINENWYIRVNNNREYIKITQVINNGVQRVRCLTVDSVDSLHLVEDNIPTHNSNTVKILTQQVYEYSKINNTKIGQLIFDPQGEYANENSQDNGALSKMGNGHDVVVYRTHLKSDGTYEERLLINFLQEDNLELLWQLMLAELNNGMSKGANYTSSLSSINFEKPQQALLPDTATFKSALYKYERRKLALYAFLKLSRYTGNIKNFYINVGKDNIETVLQLVDDGGLRPAPTKPGEVMVTSIDGAYKLFHWLLNQVNANKEMELDGANESSLIGSQENTRSVSTISQSWIKDFEEGDLAEFKKQFENYENGRNGVVAAFNRLKELYSGDSDGDVRDKIWADLEKGRVIIIDLSKGSPAVTTKLSELIVNSLISKSSSLFTNNQKPMPFQITVEEAHNLFRREGAKDSDVDPWVRLSKEAAKYHIGLVYATQEVSGVDPQILSNTSNWVIAHLNSKKETHELSSYYSFADWEEHLRSTEAKGFVRLKTESSPFVIPVQIAKFESKKEK